MEGAKILFLKVNETGKKRLKVRAVFGIKIGGMICDEVQALQCNVTACYG